jgi:capsular polysaccharide transport system permease protein
MAASFQRPKAERPPSFRTARTVLALMLREMSTTYGRSPGGYAWTIVEPVAGIALLSGVMLLGLRIRTPALGISFPLFYATGILCMGMFQRTSKSVARSLTFSSSLLSYPGVTYIDAVLARFFLQVLTQVTIGYLVLGGILLLSETRSVLDIASILHAMALAALLGLSIGSLNGVLFPLFPLWESVWGIATFPLFMVSTIIYTFEALPPVGKDILWYNPLVHIIGLMRRGFYPTYDATWIEPLYPLGVSMVMLAAGLFFMRRYNRTALDI